MDKDLEAMLDAAETDWSQDDDVTETETPLELSEEDYDDEDDEAPAAAPSLKFTPLDEPKVDIQQSAQERLRELQRKLDDAEGSDDLPTVRKILAEMRDLTKSATIDTRLGAITDAFRTAFGEKHTLQDVFKSKEWKSFGDTKRYGQSLQSLYAQAAMSGDADSIVQIFEDFKVSLGAAPKAKPPVTPRTSSAPSKPTSSPRISITKAEERYVNAIDRVMSGKMTPKELEPIEAAYRQAIGSR
jgi:hypothetical protein